MLSNLPLQISYRTGEDDLLRDFYRPCLVQSVLYRRAVGYFTSSGLAYAAKGLANLVARGGKMRLIASPQLSEGDIDALERAKDHPEVVLAQIVTRSLEDVENLLVRDRLNALSWLAASGALEVKLALRVNDQGKYSRAIYHEKIGIFSDESDNHVAFTGSANETAGGLIENFESIKVFSSWGETEPYVSLIRRDFDSLWENKTPGLRVLDFSETTRELLKQYQSSERPDPEHELDLEPSSPVFQQAPPNLDYPIQALNFGTQRPLRPYQEEAIQKWFEAGCRGILEMATGAGKTLTALNAINRLADRGPLVVIISCPYVNLAEQWVRELQNAGIPRPIKAFGGVDRWRDSLQAGMTAIQFGHRKFLPIVVVNRTFLGDSFQKLLCPDRVPHLLVADEMHNLGAENLRNRLHPGIQYRLGLSATPERHMDDEGTQALTDYFGKAVFTYDLAQAIRDRNLCPYYYHPILVDLSDDESLEYQELSTQIGQLMARQDKKDPLSQGIKMLLLKRARLMASAEGKIPALRRVLHDLKEEGHPVSRALFYCGDGQVDDPSDDDRMMRQMDAVTKLVGSEAGLRVARFSHSESMARREQLLSEVKSNRLDGLVAIRCLDEGIDLPDIRMGFILASSTNPRQFIQRRGRLLRKAEGKNHAEIWDFIVTPPPSWDDDNYNYERVMLTRELRRVQEFCKTAINAESAAHVLLDLKRRYNLLADL
jgi:DNA phosphorothioation system restriction enzyme